LVNGRRAETSVWDANDTRRLRAEQGGDGDDDNDNDNDEGGRREGSVGAAWGGVRRWVCFAS